MSSIFELQERVRRLRDALAYLKGATTKDADALREALRTRGDPATCEEWTALVVELREYAAMAETLTAPRKSRPAPERRPRAAETRAIVPVPLPVRAAATIH